MIPYAFIKEGFDLNFSTPKGGMALWINVGERATEISHIAKEHGIFLLAENAFHLDQHNDENKYIRLGFAGQSEAKIQQGLILLKPLLSKKS